MFRKLGIKSIELANEKNNKNAENIKQIKNKLNGLEYSKNDDIAYKNTFMRMIFFIIFILAFFIY